MSFLQDIRYGLRMIVKAPAFTALAMLALALGVCANTTIFSLVNDLLLRPLVGVKDPETIVAVYTSDFSSGLYGGSSYADYLDFRTQVDGFEDLAASDHIQRNSMGATEAERLRGLVVTGNYFALLGIKVQLGRTLQPADEQPANAQSVVISHGLWQRRFNSNANVIGQALNLDGKPFTIVGVTDPSFRGIQIAAPPEFWIPMNTAEHATSGRGDRGLRLTGRLKPGVTVEQAQTQLTTVAARLAQAYPKTNLGMLGRPNDPRQVTVLRESRVGPDAQGVWRVSTLLFIVVGLVLLIACANVANLLLARASVRRREIAVRLALGASRSRIIRQLLTESLLLALLGGAVGLLLTQWTTTLLPSLFPGNEAAGLDLSTDWRVLIFTLGISVFTALLFGLTPALHATRFNLLPSLKVDDKTSGQGRRRIGLRDALVISQLALSLVLLISAALVVRSVQTAIDFDPGFATQNLLIASLETRSADNLNRQQGRALYQQTLERIRSLPGVEAVTLSAVVPISGGGERRFITLEGYQPQPNEDTELNTNVVGPNYFNTMGIPFVGGRDFNEQDREGGPFVVIVNEELARRYYSGNAVGKRLQIGTHTPFIEIVGVVRTVKYRSLREEPLPFIYIPSSQEYRSGMALMVRSAGDPALLAGTVRNEIRAINKDVPVFSVETMSQHISDQIAGNRMVAVLLSIFGGGALFLAAIGIYGVISYSVAQRTHEIGVRIALGAEQRDILKLIVGRGMVLVLVGAGIGLLLAFAVTWALQGLLFGISATDPLAFTIVLLVLVGVALLACYLPARRATKVDPLVALRYE